MFHSLRFTYVFKSIQKYFPSPYTAKNHKNMKSVFLVVQLGVIIDLILYSNHYVLEKFRETEHKMGIVLCLVCCDFRFFQVFSIFLFSYSW